MSLLVGNGTHGVAHVHTGARVYAHRQTCGQTGTKRRDCVSSAPSFVGSSDSTVALWCVLDQLFNELRWTQRPAVWQGPIYLFRFFNWENFLSNFFIFFLLIESSFSSHTASWVCTVNWSDQSKFVFAAQVCKDSFHILRRCDRCDTLRRQTLWMLLCKPAVTLTFKFFYNISSSWQLNRPF